jgi:putative membrane-bound dehydrogenase-like protein
MVLPPGFTASLVAAEPDVRQPIAFTIDERGRLWVVECLSYPEWSVTGRDRVLIFEDVDGEGSFERRTVFCDRGANLTGIEVGFGGVWLCSTPHLLFVPDRDRNDVPDGEPEVVLDGWDVRGKHNLFNGLTWGPDGWLYGLNGILSESRIGQPGLPDAERVPINCGVWRYHPTERAFEVVAWGTTNPWGLDFDELGEMFISNCVIPHLFHVVPGAHFQRMFGQDFEPHLYGLMESCADHLHWAGGTWQSSRGGVGKHGEAGGGHAHAGLMVYLGGAFPEEYRGGVFISNIHGRRINRDLLRPQGSSVVATHALDFLLSGDEWFRGLELEYGPDGSVFVSDWSDAGECHESDAHGAHRDSGRIFRISFGDPRPVKVDLDGLSDLELVELQAHRNDWYARQARRLLQERAAAGKDLSAAHEALRGLLKGAGDAPRKLRALWALHTSGGLNEDDLVSLLGDSSPHLRSWAVRLLAEPGRPRRGAASGASSRSGVSGRTVEAFASLAATDPSPKVRLSLASALQRLPLPERWSIAEALAVRAEDAQDASIPLMLWYAIEPLVPYEPRRAAALLGRIRLPLVGSHLARRLTHVALDGVQGQHTGAPPLLDAVLAQVRPAASSDFAGEVLAGVVEGLRGRKDLAVPAQWPALFPLLRRHESAAVRERARLLGLLFGDSEAAAALLETVENAGADRGERERALEALVERRMPGVAKRLVELLNDPELRLAAIRGLAAYDRDETPGRLLDGYGSLSSSEREAATATLASRPSWALELLAAVEKGRVPRRDLSAYTVRQLAAFRIEAIDRKLAEVWGSVRPAAADRAERVRRLKSQLTPERLVDADLPNGRRLFAQACGSCHRLFGEGGDAGPDLTGSNRDNADYVLENVVDPSGVVGKDFTLTTVFTRDGRLVSGILRERVGAVLVLQTATERVSIPESELVDLRLSDVSMMPEGLFDTLSAEELRDVVAYLASPAQVPLPDAEKP